MNAPDAVPAPDIERPFAEPWQASAFALALHLNERGFFTWPQWAEVLSDELAKAGEAGDGDGYYVCWLAALERLVVARGVADDGTIAAITESWKRAAIATPHGKPILIENDPTRH